MIKIWPSLALSSCYLCDIPCKPDQLLCQYCFDDLNFNDCHCINCALPLCREKNDQSQEQLCGRCQTTPPHFSMTIAPFLYTHPLNFLIKQFKESRQFSVGHWLSQQLYQQLKAQTYIGEIDYLIPVPTHRRKALRRGFNPAEFITHTVSKMINIPYHDAIVTTTGNTGTNRREQKQLDRKTRYTQSKTIYQLNVNNRQNFKHQSLAIVDDVMTTGATTNTIAQLLKEAGAREIYVWVLARTPEETNL